MAGSEIAELYVLLTGVNAPLLAAFAQAAVAGEEMAAKIRASMVELNASMAGIGAEAGSGAGFAALGKEAEATAGKVKLSADEMAAAWQRDIAAMRAETAKLSEGMAVAETEMAAATAKTDTAIATQASKFSMLGEASGISNKALLNTGVVVGGLGLEFVKMAGDFQQVSEKLVTSAGEDQKALENIIRPGLISMAGQLGVSVKQLAADLYPIESAGYHGGAALKVLEAAEKGAAAEMADGTHVADALTSALHDYYPAATSVNEVTQRSKEIMSAFLAATSQGKMSFDQLASGLNNILPTAANLHIKMEDVLGVLASMTAHGISAQQATENMNHAMQKLATGGTPQMKGWAASVGIDLQDIGNKLGERGLSGSLEMVDAAIKKHMGPDQEKVFLNLKEAVNKSTPAVQSLTAELASGAMSYKDYEKAIKGLSGAEHENGAEMINLLNKQNGLGHGINTGTDVLSTYGAMWKNITGDMTTAKVAMFTTGENTNYTNESIKKISASMKDGAALQEAWTNVQKNFNQQIKQAEEGAKALGVSIGMKLLPILTPVAHAVGTVTTWLSQNQTVATALALVIGGVLTTALLAFAAKGVVALANLSAQFILNTGKGAVWAAAKIAQLLGVRVAVEAEATAEGVAEERGAARRLAAAIAGGVKWLAVKTAQGAAAAASAATHAAAEVAAWVAAGAKQLAAATVDGAKWLAVKAAQGAAAVASAVLNAAATVTAWVVAGAAMVADAVAKGAVFLATWIATGVAAAASSVAEAAIAAGAWIAANLAMIVATGGIVLAVAAVVAIGIYLYNHWSDVKRIAGEVWDWIKNKFNEVKDAIVNYVTQLANSVRDKINDVLKFFRDLPGNILGAVGDLGKTLWNAGVACMQGLYNGFLSVWNGVKDWLSSVGTWIANLKGPIDKDRQLLVPHGKAIMEGLHEGLKTRGEEVLAYVGKYANQLQGAMASSGKLGSIGLDVAGGGQGMSVGTGGSWSPPFLSGGSGGGDAGGGITIHLNVAGSVWSSGDLVKEVQTAMLRHGIRNNNPGINYSYA